MNHFEKAEKLARKAIFLANLGMALAIIALIGSLFCR